MNAEGMKIGTIVIVRIPSCFCHLFRMAKKVKWFYIGRGRDFFSLKRPFEFSRNYMQ
jgi:hypothetical protein